MPHNPWHIMIDFLIASTKSLAITTKMFICFFLLKKAKVFQSEQLSVVWEDGTPSLADSIFLQTETFEGSPNDTLVIYIQDALNKTHTILCKPNH